MYYSESHKGWQWANVALYAVGFCVLAILVVFVCYIETGCNWIYRVDPPASISGDGGWDPVDDPPQCVAPLGCGGAKLKDGGRE